MIPWLGVLCRFPFHTAAAAATATHTTIRFSFIARESFTRQISLSTATNINFRFASNKIQINAFAYIAFNIPQRNVIECSGVGVLVVPPTPSY